MKDDDTEKVSVLGKVHQKLECRPVYDAHYMQLKKTAIHKASQPIRQVQQLDRVVQSYKPVSDHKSNVSFSPLIDGFNNLLNNKRVSYFCIFLTERV